MQILAIGNSFSQDATRYLHDVARADGVSLEVVNLYIGGCSLARHHRNLLSGERAYALEIDGHAAGFSVSLPEALWNRAWDVVTWQQASHCSTTAESFAPYVFTLVEQVRRCVPHARIVTHQTWAYEAGSERLALAGCGTAEEMFGRLRENYARFHAELGADGLIPSGELFRRLTAQGVERVYRDGFHARYGLGRYALALLWYRLLCGKSAAGNTFRDFDEPVSEEERRTAQACVDGFAPLW